jgi:hypothetical protein
MTTTLNGAGSSTSDPILAGLSGEFVISSTSFDTATFSDAWIEATSGIPGSGGSIKSSLSPAASVVTAGLATGTYNDTSKEYTIASTSGLSVGDYLYVSQASLPTDNYKIASIPSSGKVTLVSNPLNGQGNKTGITYQVAWRYIGTYGTAPISGGSSAQVNYLKARLQDSAGQSGNLEELFYVMNAPNGANFINVGGQSYQGGIISTLTPSFAFLSGGATDWTNKGGVSHVELVNHSVQGVNNFRWGDNTTSEKSLAAALSGGFSLTAGDGSKYGRMRLKSKSGSSSFYNIDLEVVLDTTGPSVSFAVYGV